MIELKLILQLFIAHLLSDFVFQPQKWSDGKETSVFSKHHLYHVLVVGSLNYILSFDPGFWKAALVLTIIHLILDMSKSWMKLRKPGSELFFLDQTLHLLSIVGVVWIYSTFREIEYLFDVKVKTIAIVAGFVFCAKPSNVIIKNLLMTFSIEVSDESGSTQGDSGLPNAGKLIGIVERFLALTLILMGQYEAVGLIIAAKSILRFSGPQKSEYVLVGTLLSFGIAVFSGILIGLLA